MSMSIKYERRREETKLEVKIYHKDSTLLLNFEPEDELKILRESVRKNFNYNKINQFEIYCGNYHLKELFDDMKIKVINGLFLHNEFRIFPTTEKGIFQSTENDPFTLQTSGKSLDYMLEHHKNTVDNYMTVYDVADYSKHCYSDMTLLVQNLQSMYDEMCKQEENLKKNGLIARYDNICIKIEEQNQIKEKKEDYLSKSFIKILDLKKVERQAVEYVRENKKLMAAFYENQNKIESKTREITNVNRKQMSIIKKKENDAKLLETYIAPNKKITIQEYVRLRYFRVYKHSLIMKIYNEKNVIVYKPSGNEIKIEMKRIVDNCRFESKFKSHLEKRDDFSLNFREKLIVAIKKIVYLYNYLTGEITKINELAEDHTGGSFVYVPFTNSVYCISGLSSTWTEVMQLNKNFEITTECLWQPLNQLAFPRAYYSTFVQNDIKIYLMLGYDLWDNDYISSVVRLDTSAPSEGWKEIRLKGDKIPKLCFTACIPCSDDEVYIIGGEDENLMENPVVFCYDIRNNQIEDSNMRLPKINSKSESSQSLNLFYQENCFIPVKCQGEDPDKNFFLALYDTKNFIHLVNIKNFDYSYISHEVPSENEGLLNQDSEDEEEVGDENMHRESNKFIQNSSIQEYEN